MEDLSHDALLSPATLILGKIHWALLRAAHLMDSRRYIKVKLQAGAFTTEWTEFGEEIGTDEINWWVFKQEPQISDLKAETERALKPAQILKTKSARLEDLHPHSYDELLSTLREFAEEHSREIESIYSYVRWLEVRDPMAPKILFTYRVWGSTRMSDRTIEIPPEATSIPDAESLLLCAEIVLGLRDNLHTTYEHVQNELCFEIFDSMDPEQLSEDIQISVPPSRVLARASRKIYRECAVYFAELRDSVRNVLIDIEKFEEQRELMKSDVFWREFISKAVKTKKTETQIWDFKETLTIWHVNRDPERHAAKVEFAETVASLANAVGGVLVVGVTDRREIVGVGDSRELENRLKDASNVLAKHIEYDRDIVRFQQLEVPVKNDKKVCLVIVVAQSRAAVGVDVGQGRYTYPVRQETGLVKLSRTEIRKLHIKSDNYDFIRELRQFIADN